MATTPIFAAVAKQYYERGISVIPLWPHDATIKSAGKRPIPNLWNMYASAPVPPVIQQQWMQSYPCANIGLVCGPQSKVIFIDVDSTDGLIQEVIEKTLQVRSPWIRVGKKGYVAAYKYTPTQKNFKINPIGIDKKPILECLAIRSQAVIPPSIHPETFLPYSSNTELLDVIDLLPILPEDLEQALRHNLQHAGIELSHTGMSNLSDYVAKGARDNSMTMAAGLFAHYVTRGERTLNEAMGQMAEWFRTNIAKVEGDDIDLDKGCRKIVEFLERDVILRKKPLPLGWDKELEIETKSALDAIFTKEHQEWSSQDLKAYTYREFLAHPDIDDPKRMEAVHYIIERLARSPSLNNLDQVAIIAYLAQTSRIPGMTVGNIQKRIKELRQGNVSGSSHTEVAQAVKARMEEFGMLRQENGIFYQWRGAQWDPLEDADILRVIAEQFDGYDMTKKQGDHVGILKVLRVIVLPGITPNKEKVHGINFANGFLKFNHNKDHPELSTLVMMPHMPEFGATYTLPYRYMPEQASRCPQFHQLLFDAWGGDPDYPEKLMALQEMIAMTFFEYASVLQRCILLYGVANSGKSTILHIVKGLFPSDMASVIAPENWSDKFAPAQMAGKIINVCYELSNKKYIEGKSFKEMVDGSEQSAQFKNGQLFKFIPLAAQWFASNDLPKTTDKSEGFNRRWLILQFKKSITLTNKILGLHNNIIASEREAIAAWAIEGFLPLITRKDMTLPESHERLINDMANENNSVRFFLNESRRVMTQKRFISQLAAQALEATQAQQESNVLAMSGAQASTAVKPPRPAYKNRWKDVEAFNAYATLNHTSEETLNSEYIMFCTKTAGVKAAGSKDVRAGLREQENIHNFRQIVSITKDGQEAYSYCGIVLGMTSPLST